MFLANNRNFYLKAYTKLNIYQNYKNEESVISATDELLGYFRGKKHLEDNIFSDQAKLHLKDVKNLLKLASVINFSSLATVVCLSLFLFINRKWRYVYQSIAGGAILTLFLAGLFTLAPILDFQLFFEKFHIIIFSNDLWLFPQDDNLIKLFPESLFNEFFWKLTLNIIFSALAIILIVKILNDHATN